MSCPECGGPVVQNGPGRQKIFCSRTCYKANYRERPVDKTPLPSFSSCELCGQIFAPTKHGEKFCSRQCYKKSWPILNREKHNKRQVQKRRNNPEWFREHEARYYKTYRTKETVTKPWLYLFKSRKYEAKAKNLEFNLTFEWASSRWTGNCEITGVPFRKNEKNGPHPFSPSLDRIDPKLGYVQNNCRFILWGCNALKGAGTDDDMHVIAKAIVRSKNK